MTHDQAAYFFDLAVRKLFNAGVAVRALQVTMRAVQVQVLGHIEQPELSFMAALNVPVFTGDIAEPSIPVAEKAILLINRP